MIYPKLCIVKSAGLCLNKFKIMTMMLKAVVLVSSSLKGYKLKKLEIIKDKVI